MNRLEGLVGLIDGVDVADDPSRGSRSPRGPDVAEDPIRQTDVAIARVVHPPVAHVNMVAPCRPAGCQIVGVQTRTCVPNMTLGTSRRASARPRCSSPQRGHWRRRSPNPAAVDPFAEVFCRAVGGEWADVLDGNGPRPSAEVGVRRGLRELPGRSHQVLRHLLRQGRCGGRPPDRPARGGPGLAGVSARLARRHRRVRTGPAPGAGVQARRACRPHEPTRASAAKSPSTCATTGRGRCATADSTPPRRRPGSSRGC